MKKVLVTYSDGTSRETTVDELRAFFKEEGDNWKAWFFMKLEKHGTAEGRFATYTLVDN